MVQRYLPNDGRQARSDKDVEADADELSRSEQYVLDLTREMLLKVGAPVLLVLCAATTPMALPISSIVSRKKHKLPNIAKVTLHLTQTCAVLCNQVTSRLSTFPWTRT